MTFREMTFMSLRAINQLRDGELSNILEKASRCSYEEINAKKLSRGLNMVFCWRAPEALRFDKLFKVAQFCPTPIAMPVKIGYLAWFERTKQIIF